MYITYLSDPSQFRSSTKCTVLLFCVSLYKSCVYFLNCFFITLSSVESLKYINTTSKDKQNHIMFDFMIPSAVSDLNFH